MPSGRIFFWRIPVFDAAHRLVGGAEPEGLHRGVDHWIAFGLLASSEEK